MSENKEIMQRLSQAEDYRRWIVELKQRYLSVRLRATVQANQALLGYYWSVGRDIAAKQYANTYGSAFYKTLSADMQRELPDVTGLSETNIRYMHYFYCLYSEVIENRLQGIEELTSRILPQGVEESANRNLLQGVEELASRNRPRGVDESLAGNLPRPVAELLLVDLCSIPWFHQQRIIDKCKGNPDKAIFFVRKVLENNWGRDVLLNFLDTDLYERQGKAITNFSSTLPAVQSDLAQQLTKDPYKFDFLTLRERYDERELEDALVDNITKLLLELGNGFAFVGRQMRMQVGDEEFFPDLLFYNIRLHAYVVVELKTTKFHPSMLGQLGFYVSAIDRDMRSPIENPTIGLLICKNKDDVVAQYSLAGAAQPIGISEYELSKIYPTDFKSSMPTIKEIEDTVSKMANI